MKNPTHSRRKFFGALATGAAATGISLIPQSMKAEILPEKFDFSLDDLGEGEELDTAIKSVGKKMHPAAYDVSQANPWGFIWSNVYYMTNSQTGTPAENLGVLNVLRHHGMIFALNDATISKYELGAFINYNDPITQKAAVRNPYYEPVDGVYPLPGLDGIKGLQAKGAVFCVCNMARKVYSQFIAQKMGLKQEDVYQDFVAGTLPGIIPAPSGVWALGRLAENKIAYIDASVG